MDARFFLYFDEADLSYRIRKRGFKIMYVPSAKVYHKISESFSGKINPVQLYYSTRNELLFAREHLNLLVFIPLWIPRFFFRIIMYWLKSRDIEVIKYIIRGFRDFMEGKFGQIILSFPS
jgi:GT2 family glycosyltransferase